MIFRKKIVSNKISISAVSQTSYSISCCQLKQAEMSVAILYKLIGDENFNCSLLPCAFEKEVWLMDILSFWIVNRLDICFLFYAQVGPSEKDLIELKSASSIVPVTDGFVKLLLVPSSAPPVTPVGQSVLNMYLSRKQIYSKSSEKSAIEQFEKARSIHATDPSHKVDRLPSSVFLKSSETTTASSPREKNLKSVGRDPFAGIIRNRFPANTVTGGSIQFP